jgi:pimeloyl-ACP methyl ester carboxylesterase
MSSEHVLEKTISRDGTPIAYWRSGDGRPLVLVHGTAADHTRWDTVRALLEPHSAICVMDRRGRGASGDADEHTLDREVDDVIAVVDAVAQQWGGPVDLLGHSFGGLCALVAAGRTTNVRRLALYEPPVLALDVYPDGFLERADALLADGRREDVIVMFFREVVRMPEDQLTAFRALPAWQARVDVAHTLAREERATSAFDFDAEHWATLEVPTLLLDGSASPEFLRRSTAALAGVLPNVRVAVLQGQQHAAMDTAPDMFVEAVVTFFDREPNDSTGHQ